MAARFALLRQPQTRIDLPAAARILAPFERVDQAEMLQRLHERPGVLIQGLTEQEAISAGALLAQAEMSVRMMNVDQLVEVPKAPRSTVSGVRISDESLHIRSTKWEGDIPWQQVHLIDIVQEMEVDRKLVVASDDPLHRQPGDPPIYKTDIRVEVFLEIICRDPILRMRIDRRRLNYSDTGLTLHTNREKNFRAVCIAIKMRSEMALAGPGFHWISQGNNTNRQSRNTRERFENFATWMLTLEQVD
ncbi:MAG: hypothetical protein WEE51_01725 [Pirellulaceae bacterium]